MGSTLDPIELRKVNFGLSESNRMNPFALRMAKTL